MKALLIIYAISTIFSLIAFLLYAISSKITVKRLRKENKLLLPKDTISNFEVFIKLTLLSLVCFIPLLNIIITIGLILKGQDYIKQAIENSEEYVG